MGGRRGRLSAREFFCSKNGGVEHGFHHEIILLDRIFDIFGANKAERIHLCSGERPWCAGQFASQRGLPVPGRLP